MKEIKSLLKVMSDVLKTLAQGVEALSKKDYEVAETQDAVKLRKRKTAAAASKAKAAKKAPSKKKVETTTAVNTVFNIISRSKKGVDTATIMEKTGYNRKKVANIIFKLSKQGKIKSLQRGVYVKS